MKRFLLTAILLLVAALALSGCDIKNPFAPATEATTTTKATTAEVTTTAAEVTTTATTTTAPVTTAAPTPWILDEVLSNYITLRPEDYKNVALTLPSMPKVTAEDVETYILNIRKTNTLLSVDGPIALGDTVTLWYHGEINIGTADAPIFVESLSSSNFGGPATSLVIGSGSFIPGFEDALIGIDPKDTAAMTVRDVVYISATIAYTDADGSEKTAAWEDRVDITKQDGAYSGISRYSNALRDALCSLAVGDYATAPDGARAVFSEAFDISGDLVAENVTLSDVIVTSKRGEASFTINVPFPASYPNNTAVAGKDARWYIVIDTVKRPVLADLDYTLVSTKMGITYKMIASLSGEDAILSEEEIAAIGEDAQKQEAAVMAHYKTYILKAMEKSRESSVKEALWSAFAKHIVKAVTFKGYPEAQIKAYMDSFRADLKYQYDQYMASYGQNLFSFEEYLTAYYGKELFPEGADIDAGFRKRAEQELGYQMAIFAIAEAEGLGVAKEEREAFAAEEMRKLIEYYNTAYGTSYTEADMIAAGITHRVLVENAYFNRVMAHITETLYDLVVFEDAK